MIYVFKTNIETADHAQTMHEVLNTHFGENAKWNFDLDDCDRIFRVETHLHEAEVFIPVFRAKGFQCEELSDF